jgi:hypothetical protein
MTDLSSITSSISSGIAKPTAAVGKAANATQRSFANTLAQVEVAMGAKPKTGFTAGPTYEASTITGRTKAAFNHVITATETALHIKP